ncbi:MAG: pyrroline-5-carboxylate reductase [Chloroflexota bacterium]
MTFEGRTIAFIGGGMMGTAMMRGALERELVQLSQVTVSDPNQERGALLKQTYGVRYIQDNVAAAQGADVVVLAIKPQFFDSVVADLGGRVGDASVIVSIMAGVAIETICNRLETTQVVRAMPNTPGAIGMGMTAWMATNDVTAVGVEMAALLLGSLGETLLVAEERYLDIATAVSGSGPAYVFLFMESMIDAAVHMGFGRADAEKLVMQTLYGSIAYARESGEHPAALRNQVTSPGGTTAEALFHMERGGLRNTVARGMWAALQRSIALGGGEPRNPDTGD